MIYVLRDITNQSTIMSPEEEQSYWFKMVTESDTCEPLIFVPNHIMTKEFLAKVCENRSQTSNTLYLRFVPQHLRSLEVCKCALWTGSSLNKLLNIPYLPDSLKERHDILIEVVQKDQHALRYIPERVLTRDLCEIALKNHIWSILSIPYEMLTKDLCDFYIDHHPNGLGNVPRSLRHLDMCSKAVKECPEVFMHVPNDLKDESLCIKAVQMLASNIGYVPRRHKTPKLYLEFIRAHGYPHRKVINEMSQSKAIDILVEVLLLDPSVKDTFPEEMLAECEERINIGLAKSDNRW